MVPDYLHADAMRRLDIAAAWYLRYGLQTEKGTGALIQPILAWGQLMEKGWGIFHEVFDWNVRGWHSMQRTVARTLVPD